MWMDLGWHENRLRAPALWLIIVLFHFVSVQSRSIRKPPLAERTFVRCLPRAKKKKLGYRPTTFRVPLFKKNSLCVDVRLQARVARKASLAMSALERPENPISTNLMLGNNMEFKLT